MKPDDVKPAPSPRITTSYRLTARRRPYVILPLIIALLLFIQGAAPLAQPVCPDMAWIRLDTTPLYPQLTGVYALSDTSVYVVGLNGTILHYNGAVWSPMDSGNSATLKSVSRQVPGSSTIRY